MFSFATTISLYTFMVPGLYQALIGVRLGSEYMAVRSHGICGKFVRIITTEVLRSEAGAQELEPEPLAIIAQGELLAGELAVEPMDVLYGSGPFVLRQRSSRASLCR